MFQVSDEVFDLLQSNGLIDNTKRREPMFSASQKVFNIIQSNQLNLGCEKPEDLPDLLESTSEEQVLIFKNNPNFILWWEFDPSDLTFDVHLTSSDDVEQVSYEYYEDGSREKI